MAGRTDTSPPCVFGRCLGGMGSTTDVPKVTGAFFPTRPVSFPGPGEGVGDFVEEHLVYIVVCGAGCEIARDRDPFRGVITLSKACLGMVKPEGPRRI